MTTPSAEAPPLSLLHHPSFMMFWCARVFTNGAYAMQSVAVGWQIYDLTNNPLDLGLVGLVMFFPMVLTGVLGGQISDYFDRRRVAAACQVAKAIATIVLMAGSFGGWLSRDAILGIMFVVAVGRALEIPTLHALLPGIVPQPILPRAIAASATAQQTATIAGPAIGGFLYLLGPATVYATCAACFLVASVLISLVRAEPRSIEKKKVTLETIFAGFTYLRGHPLLMGVISLDLFAFLLGGVTALLPIFARDILETGPWGLGILRSAPALGALLMSVWLSRHAIERRAGHVLFISIAVFGLSTILFALSTSLILSVFALAIYGAADAVSVVIRHSLVQMRTPNEMLGRVLAVNTVFTGTSGTMGEFRAGAIAALLGAVPSALIGGVGAVLVAAIWWKAFPQIGRIEKLAPDP